MSPRTFTTHVSTPLSDAGFPSAEERLAGTPATYTVRGMYHAELAKELGEDFPRIASELESPPPGGRYIPFRAYSMRDHARLALEVARRRSPDASMRESVRRLHRGNMQTFMTSTVGSVIAAMVNNVKDALMRSPDAFAQSRDGGTVKSRSIEARAVEITMHDSNPWLDCADLGSLEGLVMHYDVEPRIEVELTSPVDAVYLVRWR